MGKRRGSRGTWSLLVMGFCGVFAILLGPTVFVPVALATGTGLLVRVVGSVNKDEVEPHQPIAAPPSCVRVLHFGTATEDRAT